MPSSSMQPVRNLLTWSIDYSFEEIRILVDLPTITRILVCWERNHQRFWVKVQEISAGTRNTSLLETAVPGSVGSTKVTSQIGPPAD